MPSERPLGPRMSRVAAWAAAIALTLGTFLIVTHETIGEHRGSAFDRVLLIGLANLRTPGLTAVMIDLTALGSSTLVAMFTLISFATLIVIRDGRGALHLLAASIGTSIWTPATKNLIEKARPTEVRHLVEVSGYSYPSGHSLAAATFYLTIAVIGAGHLETAAAKAVLIVSAGLVVVLVAVSRVYLGVHYPTDVISGVALGAAWALTLAVLVALVSRPTRPRSKA